MSRAKLGKAYDDYLIDLVKEYRRLNDGRPYTIDEISDWALTTGQWRPHRTSLRRELKRHLARASRKYRIEDPQGRRVRAMHAAKAPKAVDEHGNFVFEVIWDYIHTMTREHAEMSFQQRWDKLADGARSLKADIDSFNDNNSNAGQDGIQRKFDFTREVEPAAPQVVDEVRPTTTAPSKPR